LDIVYEGMNCEIRALLKHWDFYAKNIDEAWDLLTLLTQHTYEFETSCANSYIPSPCIPNYIPLVC